MARRVASAGNDGWQATRARQSAPTVASRDPRRIVISRIVALPRSVRVDDAPCAHRPRAGDREGPAGTIRRGSTGRPPGRARSTRADAADSAQASRARSGAGTDAGTTTSTRSPASRTEAPSGTPTSPSRTMDTTRIGAGGGTSRSARPHRRDESPRRSSTTLPAAVSMGTESRTVAPWGVPARPRRRATVATVVPWRATETRTTKKTTLSTKRPPGTPSVIGKVASTMGTAPRRPAQVMMASSARGRRKGRRHTRTATGRATRISAAATTMPWTATSASSEGKISSPRTRNRPTSATVARLRWNAIRLSRWRGVRSASTRPAR